MTAGGQYWFCHVAALTPQVGRLMARHGLQLCVWWWVRAGPAQVPNTELLALVPSSSHDLQL